MSKIKRLDIHGIRSFEPSEAGDTQGIEFGTPLTLIVGQNGSGKTTIIEALKYSLTSEYPPGTLRGHSFVNDPKLSNSREVNAVVKLELEDIKGEKVVVTKKLRATQYGSSTITLKGLEGTLTKGPDAEAVHIYGTLNEEMCRIMGVPDAVLNNVIFCHQEDSCWPLDEPQKVKVKFDAIFNTSQYSKCIEFLTKKERELAPEVRACKTSMNYVLKDMLVAREKRTQLEELNTKYEEHVDSIEGFQKELEELQGKLKELKEIDRKHVTALADLSNCKEKIQSADEEILRLREAIKEPYEGAIEELESTLNTFEAQHAEKQTKLQGLEKNLQIKKAEILRYQSLKETFLKEEAVYGAQAEEHESVLTKMNEALTKFEEVIRRIKEDDRARDYLDALNSFLDTCETSIDKSKIDIKSVNENLELIHMFRESKARSGYDTRLGEIQERIDEERGRRAGIEKEIQMKEETIGNCTSEIEDLSQRLGKLENSDELLNKLNEEELGVDTRIEEIENAGIIGKCEEELLTIGQEMGEIEEKLKNAKSDYNLLSSDSSKAAEVKLFEEQKVEKDLECSDKLGQADEHLRIIFGSDPIDEDNLARDLEVRIRTIRKEIKEREYDIKKKEYEVSKAETQSQNIVVELEKKCNQLKDWKEVVADSFGGQSFDVFYKQVGDKLAGLQKKDYYADATQYLYRKYIEDLKEKAACPLCNRDFENSEHVHDLQNTIEQNIENLSKSRAADKAQIAKSKAANKSLQDMLPMYEIQKKLEEKEIPELKKRKDELDEKITDLKGVIEGLTETLTTLKNNIVIACNLTATVGVFDHHKKELKKIEANIKRIEGQRDPRAKELTISLEEAQAAVETLEVELKAKRTLKDEKEELRNTTRDTLAEAQKGKNEVIKKKMEISSELQNRDRHLQRKALMEEKIGELLASIEKLRAELPSLNSEIEAQEEAKGVCLKEKEAEIDGIRAEKEANDRDFTLLSDLQVQVGNFEKLKTRHDERQQGFEKLKFMMDEAEVKKEEFEKGVSEIKEEINSAELRERDLKDNYTLKKKNGEIEELRTVLATHEKEIAEMEVEGLEEKIKELTGQCREIGSKMYELKGRRNEMIESQARLERELNSHRLKNAEENYREKLAKKTVWEAASRDILIYKRALDIAIVTFHKKRMGAINRKLKELWRKIYKGNDIDYIEIKCDDEDGSGKVREGSKKNYNYRVVMYRRGIELDMRSRCSAGQKLLASLIIRIAIAESFASRCGIMTLDEPTTNLDSGAIEGLAETLADIAMAMQESATFQLVVISHDEDFIEKLMRIDQAETCYKISRDKKGNSIISQISK